MLRKTVYLAFLALCLVAGGCIAGCIAGCAP